MKNTQRTTAKCICLTVLGFSYGTTRMLAFVCIIDVRFSVRCLDGKRTCGIPKSRIHPEANEQNIQQARQKHNTNESPTTNTRKCANAQMPAFGVKLFGVRLLKAWMLFMWEPFFLLSRERICSSHSNRNLDICACISPIFDALDKLWGLKMYKFANGD